MTKSGSTTGVKESRKACEGGTYWKLKMNGIDERIWARAMEDMEEGCSGAADQAWEEFLIGRSKD